jgi:mono/diheme cytochrome c family protein
MIIRPISAIAIAFGALGVAIACSSQQNQSSAPAVSTVVKAAPAASAPEVLARGRTLYKTNCTPCHGESGRGDGPAASALKPAPRDHTDRAYMSTLTNEDLAKTIQIGGALKNKPLMPGNPQIKGADLDALVAYVRSLSAGS